MGEIYLNFRGIQMKNIGTQTIETERLILRRFKEGDAEAMFKNWASDDMVTKFLTWPTHKSIEDTKSVLAMWIGEYEKEDKYEWCIELKEIGEAIGSLGGFNLNDKVESVEIGYCISRKYWNQGITSEAFSAIIKFFFEEVGMKRIESYHDVNNPNSGKVMQKCGLIYEGTKRKSDWNNTGICDTAYYGILKEDFHK